MKNNKQMSKITYLYVTQLNHVINVTRQNLRGIYCADLRLFVKQQTKNHLNVFDLFKSTKTLLNKLHCNFDSCKIITTCVKLKHSRIP